MTAAGADRTGAPVVVVRGGGDLGTGVAHVLHEAGYRVLVLEVERPKAVRRAAMSSRSSGWLWMSP